MVELHVERTIAATPERVFDWLAAPGNLTSAPLVLRARWAEGVSGPAAGARREVVAAGMWFREEVTEYDPPRGYSYRITASFPAINHRGGTLTFTSVPDGTRVDWVSTYTHPRRGGGGAMEAVSSRLLPWNFAAILAGCAKALEG